MGHGYRPLISKIRCENPNKHGTRVKNYNLLHYIATREGVDLSNINSLEAAINGNVDLSDAGEELLYSQAPNEEYLKYMAHRPRSHGLFGNIETDKFESVSKVLNKASDDKKTIYRGVISLSEMDAQALGYNNVAKWNLYLQSVMPDIARTLGLSPNSITWVAAFHAEQKHPHVHYMLWDNRDIIHKPFIHTAQQLECREICQQAMFTDENEAILREVTAAEREEYYEAQNTSRKNITDYVKNVFEDGNFIPGVYSENLPGRMTPETHQELNELYKKVLASMPGKGRISYKFMPEECKAYIDRITDIFMKQPDIRAEYSAYIRSVQEIHRSLGKTKEEIKQARDYAIKELQIRTGNIVLKGVCNIKDDLIQDQPNNKLEKGSLERNESSSEVDISVEDNRQEIIKDNNENNIFFKEIDKLTDSKSKSFDPVKAEEMLLEKLNQNMEGDKSEIYKRLGTLYADNNSVMENLEKAVQCLDKCTPDSDVHMLLGKIYGDKKYSGFDIHKSEAFYLKVAEDSSKKYIRLRLSRMYADAKSEICDYDKALDILTGYTDKKGSVSLQKGNIYSAPDSDFYDIGNALACYEIAADKGNSHGAYFAGKIYADSKSAFFNLDKGIAYLESAAKDSIMPAQVMLGKLYMNKECSCYSIPKAYQHLSNALDSLKNIEEKEYCKLSMSELQTKAQICFYMGKIFSNQDYKQDYGKALDYLKMGIDAYLKMGESNNVLINQMYIKIAQIYSDKDDLYYDLQNAEKLLLKALNNTITLQNQGSKSKSEEEIQHKNTAQSIKLKLSKFYMDDSGILYNLDKAMNILKEESDEKGIFAVKRGNIYANAGFSGYNMQKAIECYKDAAAQLNTSAMVKLGKCYIYGMGIEQDKDKGMFWLNSAAELGDEYAKEYLKNMESTKWNNFTYSMLRQIFSSMSQTKQQSIQRLQQTEFKSKSKQAKKEAYLHRN